MNKITLRYPVFERRIWQALGSLRNAQKLSREEKVVGGPVSAHQVIVWDIHPGSARERAKEGGGMEGRRHFPPSIALHFETGAGVAKPWNPTLARDLPKGIEA